MKPFFSLIALVLLPCFLFTSCDDDDSTENNNESCIQCALKNSTGATLLLDNEICGTGQELNDYKTALADSNQILCGDIKVRDMDHGADVQYSESICDLQAAIDAAVERVRDEHGGCSYCQTGFEETSTTAPVLDCQAK